MRRRRGDSRFAETAGECRTSLSILSNSKGTSVEAGDGPAAGRPVRFWGAGRRSRRGGEENMPGVVLPFQFMSTTMEWPALDPRFPVGPYASPGNVATAERIHAIATLEELPDRLRDAVAGLDNGQLDTPYREGGWTVRQVTHHIADSHMNAFIRVRLALTEDWPTVAPYDEKAWALLHDGTGPVECSLNLVEGLHERWVRLLESLDGDEWQRGFKHPKMGPMTIEAATLLYAWHSRHHVAHITHLRKKRAW